MCRNKSLEFDENELHNCAMNYQGSSGSMESNDAVHIFKRSENIYNVRYKTYIGDGDSSSFQSVVDAKPCKNLTCRGRVY